MIKKIAARAVVAIAAIGFTQASMIAPVHAQPPGYNNCTNYAVFVCANYADQIGLYGNPPYCVNIVKQNCEAGYYYEDIIFPGAYRSILPLKAWEDIGN